MREAKFRGFSKDDGKWHFGHGHFLIEHTENSGLEDYSVLHTDGSPKYVVPESVGEYTCLKDKNGVEIYEGDIVRFTGMVNTIGEIKYNERLAMFQATKWNAASWGIYPESYVESEIIGNIYEHPHLLEATQ